MLSWQIAEIIIIFSLIYVIYVNTEQEVDFIYFICLIYLYQFMHILFQENTIFFRVLF